MSTFGVANQNPNKSTEVTVLFNFNYIYVCIVHEFFDIVTYCISVCNSYLIAK